MSERFCGWGRVAAVVLPAVLAGCGAAEDGGEPARQTVSGTVTFDGKPLDEGRIRFQNGKASAEGAITDGSYTIPESEGPLPGSYTVYIVSGHEAPGLKDGELPGVPQPAPPEKIPPQYNSMSTLTAQVEADGDSAIDFDLKP
jgi:hypothetical protein